MKNQKCGYKNALLGFLGWQFRETIFPPVCLMAIFCGKIKILDQNCLVFLGENLKMLLSYWKWKPSILSNSEILSKNKDYQLLKQTFFVYVVCVTILKILFEISTLEIDVAAKFCSNKKILKFGAKSAWFQYFWTKKL